MCPRWMEGKCYKGEVLKPLMLVAAALCVQGLRPDPPLIVTEPLPGDDAYEEMLRLKGSPGYVFGYLYLRQVK